MRYLSRVVCLICKQAAGELLQTLAVVVGGHGGVAFVSATATQAPAVNFFNSGLKCV